MPYIGNAVSKASQTRRFDVTGSTSATHTLSWVAPNEQSLIVTINGVKQHEDAYSVSGTTLTLTSALVAADKLEVVGIIDVGTTDTPAQDSVNTDQLATTGTASSSTFLRGDMAWTAVSDVSGFNSMQQFTSSGTWTKPSGITKIVVEIFGGGGGGGGGRSSGSYPNGANGGGAGGYSMKVIDVSSISTATVTIGAGSSGAAADNDASAGGNSTWVDGTNTLTANGGTGGLMGQNNISNLGGTASGGDINVSGGAGECGYHNSTLGHGGTGGIQSGSVGGCGVGDYYGNTALTCRNAFGYAHGGAGGNGSAGGGTKTGGNGAGGWCKVMEYK
jgi:hypothetical protein